MAGDFVTRPDGLTQDDDRFLARLARGIAARGLTAPAVLALECLRPAAFLGGQAMRFLSPLVPLVASGEDWDRLAQLLEVRGSVERLLSHLEALPEALAGRDGGLEPGRQAYAVVDCGSTTTKAVLLARVGGRYSDEWHTTHMIDPRSIVPESIMPGYPFLAENRLDYSDIARHLEVNRTVGVPYTDEMIANAVADLETQANPDEGDVDALLARYPKAQARVFDGEAGKITELDALIAYMQMLGTLVEFDSFDAAANSR